MLGGQRKNDAERLKDPENRNVRLCGAWSFGSGTSESGSFSPAGTERARSLRRRSPSRHAVAATA